MKKHIIGLVAVRTTSSRLKNKAFRLLNGKPILEVLIDRLKSKSYLDEAVICTTTLSDDDVIEELCKKRNIPCFRGENENVLKRFCDASRFYPSTYVARITGDNPLTDFECMDRCLRHLENVDCDYSRPVGLPLGTAAEVIRTEKLHELLRRSISAELSEYMTYFFEISPFIKTDLYCVSEEVFMPDLRLTIDYESDLLFIENLIKHFGGKIPTLAEIVHYCRKDTNYPKVSEDVLKANEIKSRIKFRQ